MKGGNRPGASRKTAIAEQRDANSLWKVFTSKYTLKEFAQLLGKKHSIKEVWIQKALAG